MKAVYAISFLILISSITLAQSKPLNVAKGKLAVQGYDVVSYFAGEVKKGQPEISAIYDGAKYYFSSVDHKNTFEKNASKYAPQYGGWCAYAMGVNGSKVKIDPKTYKILAGKLYLFYNFRGTNTLDSWNKNEGSLKSEADKQWNNL